MRVGHVTAISGISSAIIPILGITIASIMSIDWFVWETDALSELGSQNEPYSWAFNIGLFLGGSLGAIFGLGLLSAMKDFVGKLGALVFVVAAVALAGVGIFNLGYDAATHNVLAIAFFVLLAVSLCLIAFGFHRRSTASLKYVTTGAACITFITLLLIVFMRHPHFAIKEIVFALAGSAWMAYAGYKLHLDS